MDSYKDSRFGKNIIYNKSKTIENKINKSQTQDFKRNNYTSEKENISKINRENIPENNFFMNISTIIKDNNNYMDKFYQKEIEDIFNKENIEFNDFSKNIIYEENTDLKFFNLKPNFCFFSYYLNKFFILASLKPKIINTSQHEYYFYIFENKKFLKKIKLKFENYLNKEEKFEIENLILNLKNNNQLCLYSCSKIAIINDLSDLLTYNDNSEIKVNLILDISSFNCRKGDFGKNNSVKFLKFSFWDFDNHFGLLSSNNIFQVFYFNPENINKPFENLVSIYLNKILINKKNFNIIDFDFGQTNFAFIWECFTIFFLDIKGNIIYCTPIFPKRINLNYLMPLEKMNKFLKMHYCLEKNENKKINLENREDHPYHEITEKNQFDSDDEESANRNIIKNLLDLEKKQILDKINLGKISINKNNLHDSKKKNIDTKKNIIEINEYLNNFNNSDNINFKILNIVDKIKHDNPNKMSNISIGNYTQLKILNTYPLTILRIYKNENIDILIIFNQLKPIREKKNLEIDFPYNHQSAYLIESKNLSENNKNLNEVLKNMNINKTIKIVGNPNNKTQLVINILSDVYLLNLNFIKEISNKFLFVNPSKQLNDLAINKSINVNLISELIPIIKIDYSKIKNFIEKKFSFIGLSFFNIINDESNLNLNSQENFYYKKNVDRVLFIGFNTKNKIFCKEYTSYKDVSDIFSDQKYLKNKNLDFTKFISSLDSEKKRTTIQNFLLKINNFKKLNYTNNSLEIIRTIRKM